MWTSSLPYNAEVNKLAVKRDLHEKKLFFSELRFEWW